MAISLTNANGDPVSAFGTGSSQWATGATTNPFSSTAANTFGSAARSGLSNAGFSSNTAAGATSTLAGNTQSMGYSLAGSDRASRGGLGGATGGAGGRMSTAPQLTTDQEIGIPATDTSEQPGQKPDAIPVYQVQPPEERRPLGLGDLKKFATGIGDRFRSDSPGPTYAATRGAEGVAEDAAEAAA